MVVWKAILSCIPIAGCSQLFAVALDFRNATIVVAAQASTPQQKGAKMLAEEIEKRTQLRLKIASAPVPGQPAFILGRVEAVKKLAPSVGASVKPGPAEGFTLVSSAGGTAPQAIVAGDDDRGVVFGAGYLLRQLTMKRQQLELSASLNISTAPKVAVRGHQLGYRPKTNAYDAWSVPMWDQYIRELAIFGTNTIELIPPRSDDADDSPHFPLPKMEMMVEMSRIANEYGLNVSIWYPAMDRDYSDPKTVDFALKEWEEVFRRLPHIDAIFVPGGDPGHTEPKYLLALLEKQAVSLHRYHRKAEIWISPQSFDQKWMEEFYSILDQQPGWLTGVVFGPQLRGSIVELRQRVPKRYRVRFYPDITHSIHAEFPVPDWDWPFATTEGREGINPRPLGEATIFHRYQPYADGFVTYSEGCNDDVNKFVWSSLGWDPNRDVKDILRDFSHFFIGPDAADSFADGLLALEQNWKGPVGSNSGIDVTLEQFQTLEENATPQQRLNWRFQQALYRAYYDAYVRSRFLTEKQQEEGATSEMRNAKRIGSLEAMAAAERKLDADILTADARQYRARVFELAEALFQSIHMQLSVARYQAIALGRGANLDAIDFALNNRVWLKKRFEMIRALTDESGRVAQINKILNWTNPGPGGFYDDLGNLTQQPHLVLGEGFQKDPDFLKSAMVSFGEAPERGWRTSWYTDAESLNDEPLRMRYTGLAPDVHYKLRIVYGGDMHRVPIRLTANGSIQIHPPLERPWPPAPLEFEIPMEATHGGTLSLEWTRPEGLGGNGRGAQVAEVWLMLVSSK